MNRRMYWYSVLSGALLLSAGGVRTRGQEAPASGAISIVRGPGPEPEMIGERIELLGFDGVHGGNVIIGVPFSAIGVSEKTQTLADGNHIVRKTESKLFRDGQGRFRREVTLPTFGPLAISGRPDSFISVDDPVARTHFVLHPDTKTAEKLEVQSGNVKEVIKGGAEYHRQQVIAEPSLKREDLGSQMIEGVSAQGTRVTHTIPAGQIGNEKPIVVVSESWYSSELQTVIMSKSSDPRFGETSFTLTNIQRTEPEASLFAVPSDYTVTTGKDRMFIRKFVGGPDAAPPPGDN